MTEEDDIEIIEEQDGLSSSQRVLKDMEKKKNKSATPFTWEKAIMNLNIKEASLLLVDTIDHGCNPILYAGSQGFDVQASVRDTGGGVNFSCAVDSVFVEDHYSRNSKYKTVIQPFGYQRQRKKRVLRTDVNWEANGGGVREADYFEDAEEDKEGEGEGEADGKKEKMDNSTPSTSSFSDRPQDDVDDIASVMEKDRPPPWFSIQFSINPLQEVADYKLGLTIRPVTIVLAASLLDRVYDFFRPEKEMYVVSDIRSAAYSRLDALGKQTAAQLALALEDEKLVNISLRVEAPHVIIPESLEDETSSVLLLDLGTLHLQSNATMDEMCKHLEERKRKGTEGLIPLKVLKKLQAHQLQKQLREKKKAMEEKSSNNAEEARKTEVERKVESLYDRFSLDISSLQAVMLDTKQMLAINGGKMRLPSPEEEAAQRREEEEEERRKWHTPERPLDNNSNKSAGQREEEKVYTQSDNIQEKEKEKDREEDNENEAEKGKSRFETEPLTSQMKRLDDEVSMNQIPSLSVTKDMQFINRFDVHVSLQVSKVESDVLPKVST